MSWNYNYLNSTNAFVVDNQSFGNRNCDDVVISYVDNLLHIATLKVWKKRGFSIKKFEQLPKIHFGSRVQNARVVDSLLSGHTNFEDIYP